MGSLKKATPLKVGANVLFNVKHSVFSSGLYRRYRNFTDSAPAKELADYTAGGEFHSAPNRLLYLYYTLFRFFVNRVFVFFSGLIISSSTAAKASSAMAVSTVKLPVMAKLPNWYMHSDTV